MRPRTPGFQSERLLEARTARGMTLTALAQAISRSVSSLSKWESAEQTPEPAALEALAQVLALPRDYFLRAPLDVGERPRFFRSMANTTKRARARIEQRLRWLQGISFDVQEWIDLPTVDLPRLDVRDYRALRPEDIEDVAFQCRQHWRLGQAPIPDMLMVLENAGIVVGYDAFEAPSIDGVSHWSAADDRPYVLLSKDKRAAVRSRFDAAHELGHLLLHSHIDTHSLDDREAFKEIERQAHRFAGAFLLPAEGFANELSEPSLDGLSILKPRWGAAVTAMIIRCKHLRIITDDHATQLFKYASSRGWSRKEPYDDSIPLERPRLMERSVRLLLSEGGLNINTLLGELRLFPADLEDLVGLPSGFLSQGPTQVTVMPTPRLKTQQAEVRAPVVPFRRKDRQS